MNKYRYLLFDADNTLFDFDLAEYLSFKYTASVKGLYFTEALYSLYTEINKEHWKMLEKGTITLDELKYERFRVLLCSLGFDNDGNTLAKANEMRDIYTPTLASHSELIDGARELLTSLRESGKYSISMITNGIAKTQDGRLTAAGITDIFDGGIYISERIGAAKPSPLFFDAVFDGIGNPPKDEVLVIGDSLTSDCDGAIGYGIDICRYNPHGLSDGGRKITYTIKKLDELYDILEV